MGCVEVEAVAVELGHELSLFGIQGRQLRDGLAAADRGLRLGQLDE